MTTPPAPTPTVYPPAPIPTTQMPAQGADIEALVPGVWAPGQADGAVAWALSQVEDYCNRHFAQVRGDVVTISPIGNEALLPDPPVTNVTSVSAFMRPMGTFGAPQWVSLSSWQATPSGRLFDTSIVQYRSDPLTGANMWSTWPTLPESLQVTYDHGFVNWPQPVVEAVKALAAQFLVNPTGMSEQRTAETMYRWITGGVAAMGATSSGKPAGGIGTAASLDRLVLMEVS